MTDLLDFRTVRVKDVSDKPVEEDQFCTVAEFAAYNFLDEEDPAAAIKDFKETLRGGPYRLEVALGAAYEISLAD